MAETRNHSQGLYLGPRPLITEKLKYMLSYGRRKKLFLLRIVKKKKNPGGSDQ